VFPRDRASVARTARNTPGARGKKARPARAVCVLRNGGATKTKAKRRRTAYGGNCHSRPRCLPAAGGTVFAPRLLVGLRVEEHLGGATGRGAYHGSLLVQPVVRRRRVFGPRRVFGKQPSSTGGLVTAAFACPEPNERIESAGRPPNGLVPSQADLCFLASRAINVRQVFATPWRSSRWMGSGGMERNAPSIGGRVQFHFVRAGSPRPPAVRPAHRKPG